MIEMNIPVCRPKDRQLLSRRKEFAQQIGFPLVLRPSFTLGGTGGSIVFTKEELDEALNAGLTASPIHEVLVEKPYWAGKNSNWNCCGIIKTMW